MPDKSLQWCLTLCNPLDCNPPGSSVHGILQARTLEWTAISSSSQEYIKNSYTLVPWWLRGKEPACQRRRLGFDPWVRKTTLEEELASHSSVLAWRIPWTEEPGGLQSVGLQRVRQDLATEPARTSLLRILSTAPELEDSGVGNSKMP